MGFLAEFLFKMVCEAIPSVQKATDKVMDIAMDGKEKSDKTNADFERGYRYACSLSFEELENETRRRHEKNKNDVYSLGIYKRYKELK